MLYSAVRDLDTSAGPPRQLLANLYSPHRTSPLNLFACLHIDFMSRWVYSQLFALSVEYTVVFVSTLQLGVFIPFTLVEPQYFTKYMNSA